MSETTTAPQPTPETQPAPETDWKAEARKWEARAKENSGAAERLAELENAQKTELQRANEALAAAQAEAQTARIEALRLTVAAAKGVPAALIGRLQGSTEEELSADADTLLAAFPQPPSPSVGPRTPVEALRPGALPNPPEPTLAEQIASAEKDGDWATARLLKSHQLMELQRNTR